MGKVFIAAPWSKRDKARTVAQELEHYGVTIGHRWWDTKDTKDSADYAKHAKLDLQGVDEADFLVGLVDEKLGVGMWIEI